MRSLIKENRLLFIVTIFLSVLVSAAFVFIAMVLREVTDTAVSGDMARFRDVIIISVIYLIGMGVVNFFASMLSKLLICRIVRQLRCRVFSGIIKRNMKDYSSVNTADYISAVTNDIKLVEDNGIQPLLVIIENAVMFITAVIILFTINVIIGLCLIGCLILMFSIPMLFGKALQRKQNIVSKKMSLFTSKIKDILAGYEVIKSYGMDEQIASEYEAQNAENTQAKFRADRVTVLNASVSEVLAYITIFSGFFIGAYFILIGEISAGVLLALIQLSSSFVNPLMLVMDGMPKVQGVKPVLNRLEAFSQYADESFTGTQAPVFNKRLRFNSVSFSYDNNKPVLKEMTMELYKNKKYAIVGHSGSGKSTLIRLLTGTYADYDGQILFDNDEIRSLDIQKLRGLVSVIHQNVYMFASSIRDNICLHHKYNDEELQNALTLSGVNLFIKEMPNGLDTYVGENGNNLSGGQRQRIAVARALIQKTPVLILDEGTAAIDKQTAYAIESGLLGFNDLTLITITHNMRPELLHEYDKIIFMQDGKIKDTGTFEELLNGSESFNDFYQLPDSDDKLSA